MMTAGRPLTGRLSGRPALPAFTRGNRGFIWRAPAPSRASIAAGASRLLPDAGPGRVNSASGDDKPAGRSDRRSPVGRCFCCPLFGRSGCHRHTGRPVGHQFLEQSRDDIRQRLELISISYKFAHPHPRMSADPVLLPGGPGVGAGISYCPSRQRNWTRSLPKCRKFAATTHRTLGEQRL